MYFVKLGYPITAIKCQPEELVACSLPLFPQSQRPPTDRDCSASQLHRVGKSAERHTALHIDISL